MLLATNVNVPKWKSLCEPAILPLTTMHFPSPRELVRDFEVNTYPVKLKDSEYDDPSRLLDELVRQRLANAFQLAVQEGEDETGHRVDTKTNKDNDTKRTEYLLHSGRTAHQLVYDALENEIRVTEYVLKRRSTIPLMGYTYEKFCPIRRKWIRKQAQFTLQDSLHWKNIDEVVSGAEWDATQEAVSVKNQKRSEQSYVVTTDSDALTSLISQFETNVLHRKSPAKFLPQMRSNRSRRKVKVTLQKSDDETRRHWIFVDIRDIGKRTKVFTLQWLSASHSSVHSFVDSMYTEAKNLGISFGRFPRLGKVLDSPRAILFCPYRHFRGHPKT